MDIVTSVQSAVAVSFAQWLRHETNTCKTKFYFFDFKLYHVLLNDEILTAVLVTVICTVHMSLSVNSC